MLSLLALRSPSHGTGWQDRWTFTGRDDVILRACLGQLDAYKVEVPVERYDVERGRHIMDTDDRWRAAMILFSPEPTRVNEALYSPPAEAAWSDEGAQKLAELLPERLDGVRADIERRFGQSD